VNMARVLAVGQRVQSCVPEVAQVCATFLLHEQHQIVQVSPRWLPQHQHCECDHPHLQVFTTVCQQRPVQVVNLQHHYHLPTSTVTCVGSESTTYSYLLLAYTSATTRMGGTSATYLSLTDVHVTYIVPTRNYVSKETKTVIDS